LVEKREGRSPLGRYRRREGDNIKINPPELAGGIDWIDLAQERER
jgi:hypothetical protein